MSNGFEGDSAWQPVKLGAGGYLVGIDIAPDGTMVVRTDTYGAYLWDGTGWNQLATASTMPANIFYSAGVYELRIAPSNSDIFYMQMSDGLYKTVDQGATWVKTNFPVTTGYTSVANRMDGQKMAIDPTDPNIVFAGTQSEGLWVTRDGGASWQKIAAVPQSSNTNDPGLTGIVIQGSTVFVGTAGSGVYMSTDKGITWKAIGGPADVSHAVMSPDGSYYASDNSVGALWKFSGGGWQKVIDSGVHAVAIDPFDPAHIVVTNSGGGVRESKDAGVSWGDWNHSNQLESSDDIPWLENSGGYMSSGGLVFDPIVQGKLWQSGGVGVWETQLPTNMAWNTPVIWNSRSMGIEQLVANEVIAPAGGNPIFASWDRPFFEMGDLDSYAGGYGGGAFSMGWSVDYASSSPSFIVGISDYWGTEQSGFSTDGGETWQTFEGLPSWALNTVGGSIAASSPTNFIWAPSGDVAPAYTLDGGKTWTNINIPGKTDWTGLHHYYYLDRTTITADRVQPNTFYLYDTYSGVYRTTDGGVNWTKVYDGQVADWSYWHAKIEAVPGSPGELFFTSGPQQSDATSIPGLISFMHSTDGGASWQAVAGVEVSTFGFGAAKDPGGPATIYINGSVNDVFGIWYSTDNAQTWTQIGERPMGSLDAIRTISGDMDQFGLVYVGFGGSGYAYLDFGDSQPDPNPEPAPIPVATIASAQDNVDTLENVASGATINDATPTLSGTLSSTLADGQILVVYRDGERLTQLSPTTTSWKFTDPGAADGTHQYIVRVETSAGQAGSYSASFSLTVDTIAPNQLVNITGTSTLLSATMTTVTAESTTPSLITGEISDDLAPGESLIVFRDGVAVGTGTVSDGTWTFSDYVGSGAYEYSARVQDAAGNLGPLSTSYTTSVGTNFLYGTARGDVLIGTGGADQLSGVPATGSKTGKGTTDVLTGGSGPDIFVLGDSRGRFYDDNSAKSSGTKDYARITDFAADDKLQLNGAASEYFQKSTTVKNFSGTGIYHDTNGNGLLDSRDELIALIQNHGPVDPNSMIFVDGGSTDTAPTDVVTDPIGVDVPVRGGHRDHFYDDGSTGSPGLEEDARITRYLTDDTFRFDGSAAEYLHDNYAPFYLDGMIL